MRCICQSKIINLSLIRMKRVFVCIFLFVLRISVGAQTTQVDSLIQSLHKETTDTGRIGKLIRIGSLLDFNLSKGDSSSRYLQQAVDLSKSTGNVQLEAQAIFYLATNLFHSANYPRSLILSLENLKKLEALKREKNVRITFGNGRDLLFYQTRLLVFIYSNIGDSKKQLEYVKRMQSIYPTLPKDDGIKNYAFTISYNLANVYANLKMYDSSFHYRLLLYNQVLQNGDDQWLALASSSLGSYYDEQNNIDSAMMLFRKCIPAAEKSGRPDLVVASELHIGNLFQKKNVSDSAFYYTRQALQRLSALNNPSELLDAYKQLSELYRDNRQYDSAYKYIRNFGVLKDSLHDVTKITEAQNFVFNQTLVEQQVEQAKKETQQHAETRIKFYVLAAVIAFILLAAFFLMRNLRNKRAANVLLTKQKEEIQNSLSALKETQTQLIHSEKMASLGELTAGIAHEIQNPLNFVNNFSEVNKELVDELQEELKSGNIAEAIAISNDIKANEEKINHHGKRADAIVKGMLQHSRSSNGKKEPTDINALCDEYLRLTYHGLRAKDKSFNATLKTDFDESIGYVNVLSQDLGRVILNLLTNAFFAVNEKKQSSETLERSEVYKPTVTIATRELSSSLGDEDKVEIRVSDNGNGIPKEVLDKIFQPFFTTKPTGQGTGLGLSLSYDIVTKGHGGELKVETKEGEGTTFIILLPIV